MSSSEGSHPSFEVIRLDSDNFYTRLGLVRENVTDEAVLEAYRMLSVMCRVSDHPKHEEKLWSDRACRLNEAYKAMHTREKRDVYDATNPSGFEAPPNVRLQRGCSSDGARSSRIKRKPSRAATIEEALRYEERNSVIVDGIRVFLPPGIQLYDSQMTIIEGVISALRQSEESDTDCTSGLFESATGTGKTLAILCAICAWLIDYKARQRKQCPFHSGADSDEDACDCASAKVKIFYCTKTFAQLSQVVEEYEKLPYYMHHLLRHDIFAGRDKLCVNKTVLGAAEARDSTTLAVQCHAKLTSSKGCCKSFTNSKSGFGSDPRNLLRALRDDNVGRIWNLDDLRVTLDGLPSGTVCPYFASRTILLEPADIVFSCYPYVTNPVIRASTGMSLRDSILVFDEGHNILNQCLDDTKFTFNLKGIQTIRDETTKCVEVARKLIAAYAGHEERAPGITKSLNERIEELTAVERCLNDFIRWSQQRFRALWASSRKAEFVQKKRLCATLDDDLFLETFGELYFADDLESEQPFHSRPLRPHAHMTRACNAVYRFAEKFDGRFIKDPPVLTAMQNRSTKPNGSSLEVLMRFMHVLTFYALYTEKFACTFDSELNGGCYAHDHNFTVLVNEGRCCNVTIWARSASVCMDILRSASPRTILLTSGTLSPVQLIENELGMAFMVTETQLPSIVPATNIHAAVLTKGASGLSVDGRYAQTSDGNSHFYADVAEFLAEAAAKVPAGIVCFLGSKAKLRMLMAYMFKHGHIARIKNHKEFLYDSFDGHAEALIGKHRSAVQNGNGSLMISVFRSSLAEGINLAHDEARCVILAGLPYPDVSDEYIRDRFNTETERQEWCTMQCFVATNQAIGRSLRCAADWSSTILLDFRYAQYANRHRLPMCIQQNLEIYADPCKLYASMTSFFETFEATTRDQPPSKKQRTDDTSRPVHSECFRETPVRIGPGNVDHNSGIVPDESDVGSAKGKADDGESRREEYRGPVCIVHRTSASDAVYVLLLLNRSTHRKTFFMGACRLLALDLTEDALTTGCWYNMSLAYDKHDENRVTLLESPMDMDESEILELCETRISSDGRLQIATTVSPRSINDFKMVTATFVGYAFCAHEFEDDSDEDRPAWVVLRKQTIIDSQLYCRNEWEIAEYIQTDGKGTHREAGLTDPVCLAAPVSNYVACYVQNHKFAHLLRHRGHTYHLSGVARQTSVAYYDCVAHKCSGRLRFDFSTKDTTVTAPHNHM